jgi:hypothetical protein
MEKTMKRRNLLKTLLTLPLGIKMLSREPKEDPKPTPVTPQPDPVITLRMTPNAALSNFAVSVAPSEPWFVITRK